MGNVLSVFAVLLTLLVALGLYFKLSIIPLLLFGSLIACVISFLVFGWLGKDTEKKQQELLSKEKRLFKRSND